VGIAIADRYQYQAWEEVEHANEEILMLNPLQYQILEVRKHQQLIPLIKWPEQFQEEYTEIREYMARTKKSWAQSQSFLETEHHVSEKHSEDIPHFLETYAGVPEAYFQQLEELIEQIDPTSVKSPEHIEAAQQLLLDFTNGSLALQVDELSNRLTEILEVFYEENREARKTLETADGLRRGIVAIGVLTSLAISAILAFYTSLAIALPLQISSRRQGCGDDSRTDRKNLLAL